MVDERAYNIVCDYAAELKARLDSTERHCADLIDQNTKLQDIAARAEADRDANSEALGSAVCVITEQSAERDALAARLASAEAKLAEVEKLCADAIRTNSWPIEEFVEISAVRAALAADTTPEPTEVGD